MRIILESYKKIFSLILSLVFTVIVTFLIKYYFKPFMVILIMSIICMPVYKFIIKLKVPEKLAGAVTLITVNVLLVLIIVYMGGEIYSILRKVYSSNIEIINNIIQNISSAVNIDLNNLKIGKSVFSIINDTKLRQSAVSTGESILAYFIANICTFFILVDKKSMLDVIYRLFPEEIIKKFRRQKNNFVNMISIQGVLI
ncbi:MAG: AI-2E family transporter, partial [Clostridium butyricum]|nr:AI-2E family transporter [Clostridium butyricum]